MKQLTKEAIKFIVIMLLFANFIVMFITFLVAYFNPGQSVEIFINRYKEADIELIYFILMLPFSLFGIYLVLKNLNKEAIKTIKQKI